MKKTIVSSVDEYLSSLPVTVKALMEKLRKTIITAAPDAEEVISYQMPAYKYQGVLLYFAAYKNHIGFYPCPSAIETFKKELSVYKGAKGSVQFPLDKPVPFELITRIVKFRVQENDEKAMAKKSMKAIPKKALSKKPADDEQVEAWVNKQPEAAKSDINALRKIIKLASPKLNERIKWNAPSYYYKEDILTFGPYKTHKLLLVFHHPAVVSIKSPLLEGTYKNRRLVHFKNKTDAEKNKKELIRTIREIVKAIDKK